MIDGRMHHHIPTLLGALTKNGNTPPNGSLGAYVLPFITLIIQHCQIINKLVSKLIKPDLSSSH